MSENKSTKSQPIEKVFKPEPISIEPSEGFNKGSVPRMTNPPPPPKEESNSSEKK